MLLSYSIANTNQEDAHLYVCPAVQSEAAGHLIDLLARDGTFESTQLLDRPGGDSQGTVSSRSRKKVIRGNIMRLRSFMKSTDITRVYSTLTFREIAQAAIHFAHKFGPDATAYHIEDGAFEYSNYKNTWSPYRSNIFNSIQNYVLFGFWWRPVEVYGDLPSIPTVYATFPKHLRSELRSKNPRKISPKPLQRLGTDGGLAQYFSMMDSDSSKLGNIDTVVLVPLYSATEDSGVKEFMQKLLDRLASNGLTVGLKYHPRQSDDSRLSISHADAVVLPHTIPSELLLLKSDRTFDSVIGVASTALKSTIWLSEQTRVYSLYRIFVREEFIEDTFPELIRNFKKLGIDVLKDVSTIH
jgi:hypothetical protein